MNSIINLLVLSATAFTMTSCCCMDWCNPAPKACCPKPCAEKKPQPCCPQPHVWDDCSCSPSNYDLN